MPGNVRKNERFGGVSGGKEENAHYAMKEKGGENRRRKRCSNP